MNTNGQDGFISETTDLTRWRLKVGEDSHGQHKWVYLSSEASEAQPQTKEEKYWLGLDVGAPDLPPASTPKEAARNGFSFVKQLQSTDGHFSAEYGGPLFLIPGLVIAMYVTGLSLLAEQKIEMKRYLLNKRRKEGGWGLHTAGTPTVYGTVMNYVALRILGMGPDEGPMTEIRGLIHEMGGATGIPTWGKAWLSILGVYEWEGVNPMPVEAILLPTCLPIHPSRWWVHVRAVFWPMSYLAATRFVAEPTELTEALRQELYTAPYASIDFSAQGDNISLIDLYSPHHPVLNIINFFARIYNCLPTIPFLSRFFPLRQRALDAIYNMIVMEDEDTGYQSIGPVSKAFNLVARFAREGSESEAFKSHVDKIDDFLWLGKDGLMMCGTNGSQLWDLAFLAQAVTETGLAEEEGEGNKECLEGMLDWLDKAQIRSNSTHYPRDYRHATKGAWAFSTPEQGYTVSDTTAEGLKAALALQKLSFTAKPISIDRLRDSVDILLSMQNANGGFASYELVRASHKLEWLNAAEVFGNIMTDYCYPECSTSALSALVHFSKLDSTYRPEEIKRTVDKAIEYIHDVQRPDGSWYGSWAICFTYATMFALESLGIAGETCANSDRVRRACAFLVSKQMEDGGWGETYMSCVTGEYAQHEKSQVVQTAWSVLALIYADYPDKMVVKRAVALIMARQQPDGRWEQEDTEGIFNKNCAIDYPAFKLIFTVWALGRADMYLGPEHNQIISVAKPASSSSFESDELVPAPDTVLILHASETGNAQDVAERVGREFRRHGARAGVVGMEDFDISKLPHIPLVIFITSTHGRGDPPPAMKPLWSALLRSSLPEDILEDVNYALYALGDSSYEKFCFAGKILSRRLTGLGAVPLNDPAWGDERAPEGIEETLVPWLASTVEKMLPMLPPTPPQFVAPLNSAIPHPLFALVPAQPEGTVHKATSPSHRSWSTATLRSIKRVTSPDWYQDVEQIEFKLDAEQANYPAGAICSLQPDNLPFEVETFLELTGLEDEADKPVRVQQLSLDQPIPPHLPDQYTTTTLRQLLTRHLDLRSSPRKSFFEWLRRFATEAYEQERLDEFLSEPDEIYDYATRCHRTVLETMADFRQVQIPYSHILEVFPPLRRRQFSIASNGATHPDVVQLLVAIVQYKTNLRVPRQGSVTSWLKTLQPGAVVPIKIDGPTLFLPTSKGVPVILVGPGTGVAPMRAFVEERVRQSEAANTILYFGCRSKQEDHFFADEWESYRKLGVKVEVAASRDQDEKIYVQDLIKRDAELINDWLREREGSVYISGSSNAMPKAVREALAWCISTDSGHGQLAPDEAVEYVTEVFECGTRGGEESW